MVLRCSNPDDCGPSRTGDSRGDDPGSRQSRSMPYLAPEGCVVALSALAQDKCNNRKCDGEHRPHHPCENIECGLPAHDAPHCIAEQRLPSLETLCAWRDFVSARIDARFFDAPNEIARGARSRRLSLRREVAYPPLEGRVGSHEAQDQVRRGGVTGSPLGHCWTWRDRHPTSVRILCEPIHERASLVSDLSRGG